MTEQRKQAKIRKMRRKIADPESESDCEELEREVKQAEQLLLQNHSEFFELNKLLYRRKCSPPYNNQKTFAKTEEISLRNSIKDLKRKLELMTMLTGMEVQSYVAGDHCCIVYHMQHSAGKEIKHGLRIDMTSDQNKVTKSSLPPGFNFDAIMEDFTNILGPDCLGAIRNGLVAYYSRLEQYEALEKLLSLEAELFKALDCSHIEVSFFAKKMSGEEDEHVHVTLVIDYRVYDIRPKIYSVKETELPDGDVDALHHQCAVFKKKPLKKAFKEAFLSGIGPYTMIKQLSPIKKTRSGKKKHYNNDDTFLPEDSSDPEDENRRPDE